jgi:hypothetical protein
MEIQIIADNMHIIFNFIIGAPLNKMQSLKKGVEIDTAK